MVDGADAVAICQAATHPNMRLVPITSEEDQAFLMLHRALGLLVRQRMMAACAIPAHLAKYGIIVAQGGHRVEALVSKLDEKRATLPDDDCFALDALIGQLDALNERFEGIDGRFADIHKTHPICRLLATIPGIGPFTAMAFSGDHSRPVRIPIGSRVCGLARVDAPTELVR